MTAVIETEKLTKSYGSHRGIVDVDLEVRPGEAFGFLGPNGAGKTTTIRVLLDLIRPTAGRALVLGRDSRRESLAIRARSGYLPGELSLYPKLTGHETLRYLANLRGGVDWEYVRELTERLDCDLDRKVADLSTGNKRKIGLIQAFMHRPELLILDEPTSGLDPLVQHEFYAMADAACDAGQTVFLSSYVLPEVQRVCDRVAFIREGRLVALEDVADLTGRAVREIEVVFARPVPATAFEEGGGVSDVSVNGKGAASLRLTVTGSLDPAIKKLAEFEVLNLTSREPDLDDVFMTFYAAGEAIMLSNAFSKSLRDQTRPLLLWVIGVAFYVALLMSIYPSIRHSAGSLQGYINSLPWRSAPPFSGRAAISRRRWASSTSSCSRGWRP